jgi:hypothetical protein
MSPEESAASGRAWDEPPPEDTLVYPPTQEHRPSAGLIVVASLVILSLLVAGGLLLVRSTRGGSDSEASADTTGAGATPTTNGVATARHGVLTSHVAFGPEQVLTGLQHIEFTAPISRLRLKVPSTSHTAAAGDFTPRVDNLQILLDLVIPLRPEAARVMALTGSSYGTSSELIEVLPRSLETGAVVTVDLPVAASQVDIVYAASGVVESSATASEGAPALLTPLVVTRPRGITSTLHLWDMVVSDVNCGPENGTYAGCGSESAKGYTVDLGRDKPDVGVVAQVELTN